MSKIKYIVGDVREPIGEGRKFIVHCVNNKNLMGSGVAKALFTKWPQVRSEYIKWGNKNELVLGDIQTVKVENDIVVINMVGQDDVVAKNGIPPVRYEAFYSGLKKVKKLCVTYGGVSVHIPYLMGCDLAGGDWSIVEKIIEEELCDKGVEVIAYDINNKRGINDSAN